MYIFFMFKNNISKAIDWNYIQINDSQYHSASKLTDICRIDKKIRRNTGSLAWTSHKRTNLRPLFKRKKTFALLSTKKKLQHRFMFAYFYPDYFDFPHFHAIVNIHFVSLLLQARLFYRLLFLARRHSHQNYFMNIKLTKWRNKLCSIRAFVSMLLVTMNSTR